MKISQNAMLAALQDFQDLNYSTQHASLYESFLVSKWLNARKNESNGNEVAISLADVNEAVDSIFVLGGSYTLGRLYPFRYKWLSARDSGRRTVWNNTTRGGTKLAASIYKIGGERGERDIRYGLEANAAAIVGQTIGNREQIFPRWTSLVCLILRNYDFNATSSWGEARNELRTQLGLSEEELATITRDDYDPHPLVADEEWNVDRLPSALAPTEHHVRRDALPPAEKRRRSPVVDVAIDTRTERMLKHAVRNFPFIILVGPPGTGKSTLIKWIVEEVRAKPEEFGFDSDFSPSLMWSTPDESWSTFELVGGYTPNSGGELVWSPGVLLSAIAEDKWLVLDETNRADMDRIMGPLLTWLSEQDVEIGKTRPFDGKSIVLGWTDTPHNAVETSQDNEPVQYGTGMFWRMFGTYNPQDALRVFRFGMALSRRFVIIPVPAVTSGQFEELLNSSFTNINDHLASKISGLYSAHLEDQRSVLGPAVFLRMARYLDTMDADELDDEDTEQILAEAYIMNAGKYLASYDSHTIESLKTRVIADDNIFDDTQWGWILSQREIIL
ncbi:AAA family ATPase [Candidatus Poriferisocius sp.]|uniref:AAA family ATPase n=1 Tax=Candidatus Poriferisocius sp. TaxID=3101276 RepID=UPI003B010EFD